MPIKGREKQTLVFVFITLLILFADQYSKSLIQQNFVLGESIPIVKNILHFTFVENTGAAFGLFKNNALFFIIISALAIFVISGLIIRYIRRGVFLSRPVLHYGLILIFSGAIGNLMDRLKFGYVIDFIDVRIWPVFNIADSCITIGTLLLVLTLHFNNVKV